jgi:sialic acid synthase SpsE
VNKKKLRNFGFESDNDTFVIAEIGINHGGSLEVAKRLIDSAARTGCDAVKFQTYITEKRAPSGHQSIFNVLKECELPPHAFKDLKQHAVEAGLQFFSTPFDEESIEVLESIGIEFYKVASFDVANEPLLKMLAETGKPVMMSVGMADLPEIARAYEVLCQGNNGLGLLHCVSAYPTEEKDAYLGVIPRLQESFPNCIIGHSDHTNGIKVPLYAVAMGAQIVEKHFRISESMPCVDGPVSISESQMKKMVEEIRLLESMKRAETFGIREVERDATVFRRIK